MKSLSMNVQKTIQTAKIKSKICKNLREDFKEKLEQSHSIKRDHNKNKA